MQGVFPDPQKLTGLPFARIGEVEIAVPAEEVAKAWWYYNARQDWDKLNTGASEVVEEYGPYTRLVYLKGRREKHSLVVTWTVDLSFLRSLSHKCTYVDVYKNI